MSTTSYITTPIYYVNARPHLGHAYTTIAADVFNRFCTMQGKTAYFLTGTDEHGDKIVQAAQKEGLSPRAYVDQISQLFRDLWPELNIEYNQFIRTTDKHHIAVVQHVLQTIYDSGDIYFSEYEGKYCFGCERFYTERELVDGKCPDHQKEPEIIKESNYFFRMGKYQEWLIRHINENPGFIRPERYRNEVLAFLREPLEDLCISRPKSRLKWGITLPFDENYVTYVWFDALVNYISALGYPDGDAFRQYWPVAQHIVAKDILKPHGIYWPIMLKAAGIPIYRHLNVHGYWNVEDSKMSKSIGNVVDPLDMTSIYGLDAFRYFLMRDMVFGLDSSFSEEALVQRINSDLANDLGNLVSRVITMTHKYFGGTIPMLDEETEKSFQFGLQDAAAQTVGSFEAAMDELAFHKGLTVVWAFIGEMNKYIDVTTPWALAKQQSTRKQLQGVIYNLLEGLRVVSGLLYPVMPNTAREIQNHLGQDPEKPFFDLTVLRQWRRLEPGTEIPKAVALFPRIETKQNWTGKKPGGSSAAIELKPEIEMEDFAKVDLRVATVLSAEPVPKAKKLLKLEVDLGVPRTIVAGIAGSYAPDDLVGKQVVVVANLKPAKLMGVLSSGMILAAVDKKRCHLATLDGEVVPGTKLS